MTDYEKVVSESYSRVDVRDLFILGNKYIDRKELAADLKLASTLDCWFYRLNRYIHKIVDEFWREGYKSAMEDVVAHTMVCMDELTEDIE